MKQKTRNQLVSLLVIVTLFVVVLPSPSVAAEKIVLAGSNGTKVSLTGRWLSLIYTEVFKRLGYELQYKSYPNARAAKMAENGEVDGEIHRAASYEKITKNLLKVKESSFVVSVAAYAVTPGIVLDGWKSLKNTNYIVEYRNGSKLLEAALPKVIKPEKLFKITTVKQGLQRLILRRTDIYIEQEYVVQEALKEFHLSGRFDPSSIYKAGVMWTGASHLYLNKKYKKLLPKITQVLKAMKKEGLIERYKNIAQNSE